MYLINKDETEHTGQVKLYTNDLSLRNIQQLDNYDPVIEGDTAVLGSCRQANNLTLPYENTTLPLCWSFKRDRAPWCDVSSIF